MKKILLFSVMALVAFATGCSKDDGDSYSAQDVVGTWVLNTSDACPSQVVFSSSGAYTVTNIQQNSRGGCDVINEVKGTYSVSGNTLKSSIGNETTEGTIERLTDTELVLKGSDGEKISFRRK